jgi:hypothetical protein
MITLAPPAARRAATALPIPLDEPVTTATFPFVETVSKAVPPTGTIALHQTMIIIVRREEVHQ